MLNALKEYFLAIIIAAFLANNGSAYAHGYAGGRFASPLVVHDKRVFFIQEDGSLTVLDLTDGTVIRRIRPRDSLFADYLGARDGKLVGMSRDSLFLLDIATDDMSLIFRSDTLSLTALDAASNLPRWEKQSVYSVDFNVRDGLLYCLGERWGKQGSSSWLAAVDPLTGEEAWKKVAPSGQKWSALALTEVGVHVLVEPSDGPDAFTGLERVRTWTYSGDELPESTSIRRAPAPPRGFRDSFLVNGVEVSSTGLRKYASKNERASHDSIAMSKISNTRYGFTTGDGILTVSDKTNFQSWNAGNAASRKIHYLGDDGERWSGTPDYLNFHLLGGVQDVGATDDRIVIAATFGYVECLERATGRSLWLYISPASRPELSGRDIAWWPGSEKRAFYDDSVRRYREEIAGIGVSGTFIDGAAFPPSPRIVLDPSPFEYYRFSPHALLVASLLIFPAIGCLILHLCAGWHSLAVGGALARTAGYSAGGRTPEPRLAFDIVFLVAVLAAYSRFGWYSKPIWLALVGTAICCGLSIVGKILLILRPQ